MISRLSKSKLFKDSIIYGLSNAFYTGLPLLLMPFLVAILKPEDYGLIELFRSLTLILIPIVGLSTLSSVDRFYFDNNKNDYEKLISTLIIFHFINGIIIFILISIFSSFLSDKYFILCVYALIYCVFNQIFEIYLVILRVKQKALNFLALRFLGVAIDLGLLFGFYYILDVHDWKYRVYPSVISSVIAGLLIVFLLFIRERMPFKFNLKALKESVIFSAPLIIHMISGYILNLSNRFFILNYQGETELGNFSLAFQIGMAISFVYTSFNMAWTPTFYDWMNKQKFNQIKKVRVLIYSILIIGGILLFISWLIMSKYFPNLEKFNISSLTIAILLSSFILLSLYKFEGNYFFYRKTTSKLSIYTFISCVVAVILNFIFIPKYSTLGAAISTFFSYLTLYLLVLLNNKNEKVNI